MILDTTWSLSISGGKTSVPFWSGEHLQVPQIGKIRFSHCGTYLLWPCIHSLLLFVFPKHRLELISESYFETKHRAELNSEYHTQKPELKKGYAYFNILQLILIIKTKATSGKQSLYFKYWVMLNGRVGLISFNDLDIQKS